MSTMDDSMNSYYSYDDEDDQDGMQSVTNQLGQFQFTGLDRLRSDASDDSWEVESYAADSMEITKLRLAHSNGGLGYDEEPRYAVDDLEDWTVQSDCNDSIGMTRNRLELQHEQYNQVRAAPSGLARITRRRASLGDFVKEEQGLIAPRTTVNNMDKQRPTLRRMSMSSVAEDRSLSSHSSSGNSDDPAAAKRRPTVTRHKSMPYVKSSVHAQAVPLPATPRSSQKMARRVSNNGTPCAA